MAEMSFVEAMARAEASHCAKESGWSYRTRASQTVCRCGWIGRSEDFKQHVLMAADKLREQVGESNGD